MTKAVVAQRDQEQIALRRQLQNAGEIEKENRQTAAAVESQITELQKTIVSHEVDLSRSISINGLDERTTRAVMTFKDRLSRGEDVKTAALGIAGDGPRDRSRHGTGAAALFYGCSLGSLPSAVP